MFLSFYIQFSATLVTNILDSKQFQMKKSQLQNFISNFGLGCITIRDHLENFKK